MFVSSNAPQGFSQLVESVLIAVFALSIMVVKPSEIRIWSRKVSERHPLLFRGSLAKSHYHVRYHVVAKRWKQGSLPEWI